MTTANDEPAPRTKPRLRFSLLALFIFVTLVCLLLAWWVQPNRVAATAVFRVNSVTPTMLGDEALQSEDKRDFEIVKQTQLASLKSNFVLQAAVRKPSIASLPVLQGKDPVSWLQDHLEVEFPQNSEFLTISLRGIEANANDLVLLVDAVAKAYIDEVIYKERSQRLHSRELLSKTSTSLNQELASKWEDLIDIAKESEREIGASAQLSQQLDMKRLDRVEQELMRLENDQLQLETSGQAGNSKFFEQRIAQLRERQAELEKRLSRNAEKSVELIMRQRELERLQRIADEMSEKLERLEIESNTPPRIEQVQPAIVGPAD